MAWKPILSDLLHAIWTWLEPLIPGALGAAVGQAWEKGLGVRDRLIQWVVGLLFAAYVVPAIGHLFDWNQTIVNAAGFVVGTIAFKAVGKWREAAVEGGSGAFARLPGIVDSWLRRPGSTPTPPTDGDGQ